MVVTVVAIVVGLAVMTMGTGGLLDVHHIEAGVITRHLGARRIAVVVITLRGALPMVGDQGGTAQDLPHIRLITALRGTILVVLGKTLVLLWHHL